MAVRIKHGSTTAATVATVTLTAWYPQYVVYNRGGDDLYVSTDGVTNPTAAGDDFMVVPQNTSATFANTAAAWEQGAATVITPTADQAVANGITLNILPLGASVPIGAVFNFINGAVFTTTARGQQGDITLTGNVTVQPVLANPVLTNPAWTNPNGRQAATASTTTVLVISTLATKYSVEGISF